MEDISTLDGIVLAVFAIATARGIYIGLIREGFSIAALGGGLIAIRYGLEPGAHIVRQATSEAVGATASLVEVRPQTGFLHQIRVALAHAGHPLLGDTIYAPPGVAAAAPRHLLHATRIAYEEIEAESPRPEDWLSAYAGG